MARRNRRAVAALWAAGGLFLGLVAAPARGEFSGDLVRSQAAWEASASVPAREVASGGETGTAAYYSKRFNGRRTTSGERYRPQKLTAAHHDLPLGTRVRVTNLDTGKEVVVRVNDRCRRRREPFIDLSRSAAKELGFLGQGVARVRIEPLVEVASGAGEGAEEAAEVVSAQSP